MNLSLIEFFNGLFSLLTISICFLVGLIIVLKYFQFKKIELLFIGLAWMGVYQPWWPSALAFVLALFNIEVGLVLYIFIGNIFISLSVFLWFMGFTELILSKRKKLIVGIYTAITILMDIYIIYFLFNDYAVIGQFEGFADIKYEPLMSIYLMFINISLAVSVSIMGRESLKSNEKDLKTKGKCLIAASICYFLGGILDVGVFSMIPPALMISRSILISGSILFYMGFLLPEFIRKRVQ